MIDIVIRTNEPNIMDLYLKKVNVGQGEKLTEYFHNKMIYKKTNMTDKKQRKSL